MGSAWIHTRRVAKVRSVGCTIGPPMRYRGFLVPLDLSTSEVQVQIERVLANANAALGTTFEHDGAEEQDGVHYTVWTDDVNGPTETSWVRLTEVPREHLRHLEINATNDRILDTLGAMFLRELAATPLASGVSSAPS